MSELAILHSLTRKVKFFYIEEHGITFPKAAKVRDQAKEPSTEEFLSLNILEALRQAGLD